jgi:putative DNA modification/repair radical SAM protein
MAGGSALDKRTSGTYIEHMAQLDVRQKLEILADAAKYDASCASSGTAKRTSKDGKGLGSTEGMGICHAYAPDGRCISLLKILLTNSCIFDCHYCINRKSSNVRRARFSAQEVVNLTLSFYRRNYIEGLFLSSGIIRSPDYTMEQIVEVARSLREDHQFRGYIHLKTIPDADPELVRLAGLHADRVSINVELPTAGGLKRLAPEKDGERIEGAMRDMKRAIIDTGDARQRYRSAPRFAPAGQSTQMIVGADAATDGDIVARASTLYDRFGLRRVYYSAFSPIPDASTVLPLQRPPLMREHRLYQSDWLMRFYGFQPQEVVAATDATTGMLPLDIDPKLAWALKFRDRFPVDVNRAPRELLWRIPGLGTKAVARILSARRWRRLRLDDIARLTVSVAKVRPFIVTDDWRPVLLADRGDISALVAPKAATRQLELFAA